MLSKFEIQQWRETGYILTNNIIDKDILLKSVKFINKKYYDKKSCPNTFGSINGELEFPCNEILDWMAIDNNLISCAKQLLNSENILLTQCDTWGKHGSKNSCDFNNAQKNTNQRIHMDYGNNTFLHPIEWYKQPEAVSAIIYLSDTEITGGGTAVVPKKSATNELYEPPYINMPGQAKLKFYNDKKHAEEYISKVDPLIAFIRNKLYTHEKILKPKIGDILFYRLDTWHRGTPVKPNKVRNVMNIMWKKRDCYWINTWNKSWTKNMYYEKLENFFTKMNPKQRSVLGIPLPGDKYWTLKNIKNLLARYPNINIKPYLEKLYLSKL